MQELVSLLPLELRQAISISAPEDLVRSCHRVIDFLRPLPQFQRVVRELTDPHVGLFKKNREVSLDFKEKGNDCFAGGDYAKAWSFYSRALRHAPTSSDDGDRTLLATLYTNRATSMLNLDLIEECKRDCSRAIILSPHYAKAWYRRGKANVMSKNYEDAAHDFEAAFNMESSSSGKIHIKKDLDDALRYSNITLSPGCSPNHSKNMALSSCSFQTRESMLEVQCENTEAKGKGMISPKCIAPSTLIHSEEPLAAIILKTCRDTHCHFCLNELPRDVIFCSSCTVPFYCSEKCHAEVKNEVSVHQHECGGSNWSAVLPSDVVLAGRVMAKIIRRQDHSSNADFVHHYGRMAPEIKLELHLFSVVLSCCLNHHFGSRFQLTGSSAAELVIIMSQMKVNSMAIVHMKSVHESGIISTVNVEQIRVGQAIYSTGRLFNHSCKPNIHAYFISRRLFLRSTEMVPAGSPLELSYGPQTGQWGFEERQRLLKDQYFFTCQCRSCRNISLPDLVINAFRCKKPACPGAVLERWGERGIFMDADGKDEIIKVGQLLLLHNGPNISPGSCLNCGLELDPRQWASAAEAALLQIQRLKGCAADVDQAVKALGELRSFRHACSRDLAQAEDMVAEMFCLRGDLESALEHCKASIKILEKLYHEQHIAIGNELVKLASLQLSMGEQESSLDSVDRLKRIFSLYYGPHAEQVNPFLESLRGVAYTPSA